MTDVRVTSIVEWTDNTGAKRRHDLPAGSNLHSPGAVPGYVGRIMGPGHTPYWLRSDGTVTKATVAA